MMSGLRNAEHSMSQTFGDFFGFRKHKKHKPKEDKRKFKKMKERLDQQAAQINKLRQSQRTAEQAYEQMEKKESAMEKQVHQDHIAQQANAHSIGGKVAISSKDGKKLTAVYRNPFGA
eukprot:TRINITY_DN6799_c0_g1_i1.p1 TRINITY_DN6799_c0_g1~~TRINITY_DN6799_c0_g1_i1.p1  ORF type:complete len:118 (-),score=32.01 TRINITY_DN6799_c0_g1_i1:109-462(-)